MEQSCILGTFLMEDRCYITLKHERSKQFECNRSVLVFLLRPNVSRKLHFTVLLVGTLLSSVVVFNINVTVAAVVGGSCSLTNVKFDL